MPITFTGDTFESTNRVVTYCHSLDLALADALGNIGYPLKSITEVYGAKGVGKTTWATSMMGIIAARLQKNIAFLDWEGQSKETLEGILDAQSFFGNVKYILNKGNETSEDTLERFVEEVSDDEQNVAMMDSLGAFQPNAMVEGKIGDSNMGVMAREIGQFISKLIRVTRMSEEPGAIFLTNHLHPKIGSMLSGQDTSGGEKKKFLAHIRIDLKRVYIANSPVDFGESYLLKGHIDHNRFGFPKRDFYVFMLGGSGIHVGLTALWDCVMLGYADLSAKSIKDSVGVSMDGQSFGKFRNIFQEKNNKEFFVPFINKLREKSNTVSSENALEVYDEMMKEPEAPKKRGKK